MWGRQVYRWSDLDFEANAREGIAVDWPIRYEDIAPWYDRVEPFIGVSGQREGLAHLPDGPFLPPMAMNCVETHVAERIRASFPGERLMTIGRAAVLTAPLNGRSACHYCGPCHRGCVTRSYFSALNATLPAAEATGRMTLRPYSVVRHLTVDPSSGRVSGVHVIDAQTRRALEFRARVVFLCASAIESSRILLNSRTAQHPGGCGQCERASGPQHHGPHQVGRRHRPVRRLGGSPRHGCKTQRHLRAAVPQRRHAPERTSCVVMDSRAAVRVQAGRLVFRRRASASGSSNR